MIYLIMQETEENKTPGEKVSSGTPNYHILNLSLNNFRSYSTLKLDTSKAPVVITGHNGAGKTNILEAISLLAPGKGLRGAKLKEFDNIYEQRPWTISALVGSGENQHRIGTSREEGQESSNKRIIKIDYETKNKSAELGSVFSLIYMVPNMDHTFTSGNSIRREFLDNITSIFDQHHHKRLGIYERYMRERRKILKTRRFDSHWLSSVENTMAEQAVIIGSSRKQVFQHIDKSIKTSDYPFPKANISVRGFIEDALDELPALQVEELFRRKLEETREMDFFSGKTNFGPHRSDLMVFHTQKGVLAENCSTGEQKLLLLSIILGSSLARYDWFGACPALLLDEIIAHLDEKNRHNLLSEIVNSGIQAWMTASEPSFFEKFHEKMQFFAVKNSTICY